MNIRVGDMQVCKGDRERNSFDAKKERASNDCSLYEVFDIAQ